MAIQLVHTFGRHAGGERRLDKDVIRFGRAPDNDVVFDAEEDRIASVHHAEIRKEGSTWVLVDLASKNGTWVEGRRVDRHALETGDEIMFGSKGPRVRIVLEHDDLAIFAPPIHPPSSSDGPPPATLAPVTPPIGNEPSLSPYLSPPGPSWEPVEPTGVSAVATPDPEFDMPVIEPPVIEPPAIEPRPFVDVAAEPIAREAPSINAAPDPLRGPPTAKPASITGPMTATGAMPSVDPPPIPAPRASASGLGPNPPAPPAGANPGKKTIDEMIAAAFRMAPRSQLSPTQARAQRTRTVILTSFLALALVVVAILVVWNVRLQRASDKNAEDLAGIPHPPPPKGSDAKANAAAKDTSFSRRIYDANKKGIFMLAADGHGFCTAFAIRPSILATNAHCVKGAQRQQGTVMALENEGHGKISFRVTNMKAHPGFKDDRRGQITPDVGLIYISGKTQAVLDLATPQELTKTGAGDEVYLIGFPGRLMNAQNPAATFMAAHVGRVTDANGQPATFARAWLVEHDAQTTGGTSGSPVFDGRGKVIAINAGTYVQQDMEGSQVSPYKYAMRIDLLNTLLQER